MLREQSHRQLVPWPTLLRVAAKPPTVPRVSLGKGKGGSHRAGRKGPSRGVMAAWLHLKGQQLP